MQIIRRFATDRDTLWAMWTQAEHLRRWWGPSAWTMPICQVDLRPGGAWLYCIQSPDGARHCARLTYAEIDPPRRFTGVEAFTDENGEANDELPAADIIVEFEEAEGSTIVSNLTTYASKEARDLIFEMGVEAGINDSYGRLDAYLQSLD